MRKARGGAPTRRIAKANRLLSPALLGLRGRAEFRPQGRPMFFGLGTVAGTPRCFPFVPFALPVLLVPFLLFASVFLLPALSLCPSPVPRFCRDRPKRPNR